MDYLLFEVLPALILYIIMILNIYFKVKGFSLILTGFIEIATFVFAVNYIYFELKHGLEFGVALLIISYINGKLTQSITESRM